jgi:hypothetical protein
VIRIITLRVVTAPARTVVGHPTNRAPKFRLTSLIASAIIALSLAASPLSSIAIIIRVVPLLSRD